jgi:hypothetical protein
MAYLQERVVHYLTCDPHIFAQEERRVQYGPDADKDVWWIDALVVDPWQKTFFLGEATYNLKPSPLARKITRFYDIMDTVIRCLSLEGLQDGWNVRPWLFVRRESVSFLLSHLPKDVYPKITHLEDTAFPWEYESKRRTGQEPGKPYPHLDTRYQE